MKNDDMNDDIGDAELDAFLNGEDALSRRLRALPQPASNPQLDAAILAHVQAALEQERRPQAANDAGDSSAPPRLAPSFARRWRVPVGIAATVLAGVFAQQAFQASGARDEAALMPAVAEAVSSPPPPPAAEMAPQAPAAAAPVADAAPAPAKPIAERRIAPQKVKPSGEIQPMQQAVEEAPQMKAALPPPAAAPAPMPVAIQDMRRGLANEVTVAGARSRAPAVHKSAEEWLGIIDTLLKANLDADAKAQWERFRKAYPDHPVPEETRSRLEK